MTFGIAKTTSKTMLALLLVSFTLLSCIQANVFYGCEAALRVNRRSGNYQIRGKKDGGIAEAKCRVEKSNIVTEIYPKAIPNTFVSGYQDAFSYEFKVDYGNFTNSDMTDFLKSVNYNCYQKFNYTEANSYWANNKFKFWDNSIFLLNDAISDGICQCVISDVCEKSGSSLSSCKSLSPYTDTAEYTDFGKFAVKKEKLPLKKVYFGDTDSKAEYIYYTVHNLVCSTTSQPKVNTLYPQSCLLKVEDKLFDFNNNTCFDIVNNLTVISFEFLMEVQEILITIENGECSDITVFLEKTLTSQSYIKPCRYFVKTSASTLTLIVEKVGLQLCEMEYIYK
ncbi:unnamed protein product [Dimorphilus gyrociliatus]|uniref:Uncharacterized protein n=1 Tax=Dimorphilus gyrociliatus TaxID=2664684 RepID=A0A7I8WCI6_9ANNE|nr:unnamed protein product [Dimorphilus gyrociliatus]